ncbi:glycolipid ABC exporter (DevE) family, permease protein [gamma proteobacterium NOR5-3]|nr:glycolipid ABC exporter (DevE) family, permease protein [gamma proteobacterium NOR5-3]
MLLGWRQLWHQPMRLFSAVLGITFAVILVFVQLEFREAIYQSAVRYHVSMDYGLVMLSPKTDYLIAARQFPRARLFQARGFDGVEAVSPVYLDRGSWRNPVQRSATRTIFMVGVNPKDRGYDRLLTPEQKELIKLRDHLIFDRMSRPEYGPVVEKADAGETVETAINDREIIIDGVYSVGTSFGLDGGVVSSDLNFLRVFPDRKFSAIDLGLIHLAPDADPEAVRAEIQAAIPNDVMVMTPEEFRGKEIRYWNKTTPVGYLFAFGAVIGLVVGLIIVYQILFADVQDHLQEYATLKAMGYRQSYLRGVVLQEAVILSICGFVPGMLISNFVFSRAVDATRLPLEMTQENALTVFTLTLVMCCVSGIFALRKLGAVDPAEVFA